jgi:hypothetical protein
MMIHGFAIGHDSGLRLMPKTATTIKQAAAMYKRASCMASPRFQLLFDPTHRIDFGVKRILAPNGVAERVVVALVELPGSDAESGR